MVHIHVLLSFLRTCEIIAAQLPEGTQHPAEGDELLIRWYIVNLVKYIEFLMCLYCGAAAGGGAAPGGGRRAADVAST